MPTETIKEQRTKTYKGVTYTYEEWYHKDFHVDENTGIIDYQKLEKNYTIDQLDHCLKASKEAYYKAKRVKERHN
jgi:hypothetical protein